jgi:sugar phosphate isomerase/epimerase
MSLQNFEIKKEKIKNRFEQLKKDHPEKLKEKIKFSWSNWGFGLEPFETSVQRLRKYNINYIELHGNHYGPDLGYNASDVLETLNKYDIKVSGICGIFSPENDLSSNIPQKRQAAIDYIRREVEFGNAVGAHYLLVVPGAVGRPTPYDSEEFFRSQQTLRKVGDHFQEYGIKAAIEPVRSAEVSFCHTVEEVKEYIKAVDHPAVKHINGDVYHMFTEEDHIGEAIVNAGNQLVNLHMADSNRRALGDGFMDLDEIIMSLYLIGYNNDDKFVSAEPLGPGGDPYPAMNEMPDPSEMDKLVERSINYFRHRESVLLEQAT